MVSKRWTQEEEDFLKKNFNKMSNKELADKFGVTTISIQRKLSRLNLIRQVQKKWTEKEEDYLRDFYKETTDAELAKKFKVTPIAIKRKLNRLGLRRGERKRSVKQVKKNVEVNKVKTVVADNKEKKVSNGSYLKYNLNKTYNIGDNIFHEIYKDKGVVVEKQESHEGYELIVVDFERTGIKVLVENVKNSNNY